MAKKVGGKITIDQLMNAVSEVMDEYAVVASGVIKEAAKATGEETAKNVAEAAPVRSGAYKQSISYDQYWTKRDKGKYVVHSDKDNYRKTHLLEKGHAKVDGGRVAPSPKGGHWAPAEAKVADIFIQKIKEGLG